MTFRTTLRALAAALALAAPAGEAAAQAAPEAFEAAAFVNGRSITNFDVEQRRRLLGLGREGPAPREVAVESMVDQRLKRSAAEAAGVQISREEVEAGLSRFAAAQGTDAPGLERRLRAAGVSLAAAREFLETELMWNALIARDFGPQVSVSEAELDAEIAARGLDETVSFELGEISIPAADPAQAAAQAREVLAEYRAGGDWGALARRHSRAPTARQGGRVGWGPAERLPPGVDELVRGLEPGQATEPFEVPGGAVILVLFDRRAEPREIDAEMRERLRAQIVDRRLARRAEGRLMELKADAYVERR
jgi:parvulin-like peptidyl-prolyl isomerase